MYLDFTLKPKAQVEQPIPESWNAFAYIIEGEATFSIKENSPVLVNHMVVLSFVEGVTVWNKSSKKTLRFVLIAGEPINEPVVQYGPFVMNTQEEI
ncbi:pirin putative [Euphorbia peplus]|nr:pirin putative [Euphorbia peplus]